MNTITILFSISLFMMGISVIGMLYIYRSLERSMDVLVLSIHQLIINQKIVDKEVKDAT
jgi:hypothetical protein